MDSDEPVKIKQEMDVNDAPAAIKQEPKSELEDTSILVSEPKRDVNELVSRSSGNLKYLFYIRHRIMNLLKSATQDGGGGLNAVAAIEIKQRLNELSTFPWENGDFEQTNIFRAAKKLTKASIFGDEIAEMASKLIARWKQNRFSPFQLDSGEEMVDSEEDYETSDEESPPPRRTPVADRYSPSLNTRINSLVHNMLIGMKIITEGHKRYILDPRYQKKRADVFGHNGLEVGDWWPFQSFALRDGAHGSKMGGIYGRTSEGAYSVVVAGGIYEDNDSDSGDTLLYSGSKGSDNEDARNIAPLTTATRSLIMSTKHHQPVRVLRAAKKGNNRWAPTHGIRYDGLYNVTSYKIETDAKGLKFYQFVLTRCSGQRAIDRSRPTREEIAALERIREL